MTSNKSKLNEIIKSFSDYNNSFNIYNSFVLNKENKENYVMYILVNKSLSMKWDNKSQLKTKFVKPTGENKKLIFVTEIKR